MCMKYIVENMDYEQIGKFDTIKQAKEFIKECKRFDKENGNPFDERYTICRVYDDDSTIIVYWD